MKGMMGLFRKALDSTALKLAEAEGLTLLTEALADLCVEEGAFDGPAEARAIGAILARLKDRGLMSTEGEAKAVEMLRAHAARRRDN